MDEKLERIGIGEAEKISIRRFEKEDAQTVADLVRKTLEISNSKDYPPEFIKENIESHSAQVIEERVNESHFYVAVAGDTIIGCGGITGYWGSTTESYLVSIFVLPEYQHRGVGKQIVESLEADEGSRIDRYTMCYRCINSCPKQAITLLGKRFALC